MGLTASRSVTSHALDREFEIFQKCIDDVGVRRRQDEMNRGIPALANEPSGLPHCSPDPVDIKIVIVSRKGKNTRLRSTNNPQSGDAGNSVLELFGRIHKVPRDTEVTVLSEIIHDRPRRSDRTRWTAGQQGL